MSGDALNGPPADAVEALATAGRQVVERNLTWGTAGNVSARVGADRFAISAAGARLDELGADAIALCDVRSDGFTGRPSVEAGMHRAIYRARPDVGAVLHVSPFHTTLVASSEVALETGATTDAAHYLRRVERVPFHVPGSAELAEAAGEAAACHDVLLLENHGATLLGADVSSVLNVAEVLEFLCRMLVVAHVGFPLRLLTDEQVERLVRGIEFDGV